MPAFAHWEGTIAPHTQSAEIVSTMDLLPSLVTLAGGAQYDAVQAPLLRNLEARSLF